MREMYNMHKMPKVLEVLKMEGMLNVKNATQMWG